MRLVDRNELMALPEGTIYREWNPNCFVGDYMRLAGVCRDDAGNPIDFFEETVGLQFVESGRYDYVYSMRGVESLPENLRPLVENDRVPDHFAIDKSICREGCFDDNLRYMVLDVNDIDMIVTQLTVGLKAGAGAYAKAPE